MILALRFNQCELTCICPADDDDSIDEVIDDNGKGLYSTGLRHGDAMHISDMYPERPGLEVFTVQENEEETIRFKTPGAANARRCHWRATVESQSWC